MNFSTKEKRESFKKAFLKEGLVFPGAFNALTAKIIERKGFPGVYISGASLSAGAGVTDTGILTLNEFTRFSKYIVDAVNIPCICDADTGFGDLEQVAETVIAYENIGLVGLHLEDQVFPKKCGHLEGKEIVSTDIMCSKIEAAVAAREDKNFTIIARTDARSVEGFEKMLTRSSAYIEAGADGIFPEALKTKDEFEEVGKNIQAPLMANMTEFGVSPLLSSSELKKMGYKLIIFPVSTLRVAMKATEDFLEELKSQGSQIDYLERMQTREELYNLLDYDGLVGDNKKN